MIDKSVFFWLGFGGRRGDFGGFFGVGFFFFSQRANQQDVVLGFVFILNTYDMH